MGSWPLMARSSSFHLQLGGPRAAAWPRREELSWSMTVELPSGLLLYSWVSRWRRSDSSLKYPGTGTSGFSTGQDSGTSLWYEGTSAEMSLLRLSRIHAAIGFFLNVGGEGASGDLLCNRLLYSTRSLEGSSGLSTVYLRYIRMHIHTHILVVHFSLARDGAVHRFAFHRSPCLR